MATWRPHADFVDLSEQVNRLRTRCQRLLQESADLRAQQVQDQRTLMSVNELQTRVKLFAVDSEEKEQLLAEARHELSALRQQYAGDATSDAVRLAGEVARYQGEAAALDVQVKAANTKLTVLESRCSELESSNNLLTSQHEEAVAELVKLRKEVALQQQAGPSHATGSQPNSETRNSNSEHRTADHVDK